MLTLPALICLLCVGCSEQKMADPNESVEITGTVTLDGKPLPSAEVTFVPADGDPLVGPALTITDNKGSYSMSVNAPRDYKITVDRMTNGGPNPALKEYQGEETSLKAGVSKENTSFDFDLTSAK
ncbi:carboxypeptidase-like regulatory domain-containing protein [Gimesia sp.]|uniref:carboxypeptidase-like regulatory domain-containing protein n=1 Tax=Gimesia sp. TaxID=2024833 RepID=UPI003A8E2259